MNAKKKKLLYNCITYGVVILAFVILTVILNHDSVVPRKERILSSSLKGQLVPICCWVAMAVSLNLVVGISGELSLGHAGFMSVGAFTGAVVSGWLLNAYQMQDPTLRLVLAMAVSGVLAGIAGVLIGIPVLRLRGDYLAIVTLAFGEIIRNVMNCVYVTVDGQALRFGFLETPRGTLLLNGPMGAVNVDRISTFTAGFVLIMITLVVVLNLVNSRTGRAIMGVRDARIAAESSGIDATKYKMIAFVTSAVLAGMAGALYALNMASVIPGTFSFNASINVLVFVVLGGIGNILGSVISATLLTLLPELLRSFSEYRMLVYAVVLILVMLATNNPMIKSWTGAVGKKIRHALKGTGGRRA